MRGFARAPNCWRVTWRTADAAGAGTGLARNANDFEGMDTDRNATSRTDWPALCKGPVRPCAMNILQQIKEHNPKSSTSLACSRSCRCMKPLPPFLQAGKKNPWPLSSAQCQIGPRLVGTGSGTQLHNSTTHAARDHRGVSANWRAALCQSLRALLWLADGMYACRRQTRDLIAVFTHAAQRMGTTDTDARAVALPGDAAARRAAH